MNHDRDPRTKGGDSRTTLAQDNSEILEPSDAWIPDQYILRYINRKRWCNHYKHPKTIVETCQIKNSSKNSPNRKLFPLNVK